MDGEDRLTEVLPKNGLVYSEKGALTEVLCKPKLMPIKSIQLQKLEDQIVAATTQDGEDDDDGGMGMGIMEEDFDLNAENDNGERGGGEATSAENESLLSGEREV